MFVPDRERTGCCLLHPLLGVFRLRVSFPSPIKIGTRKCPNVIYRCLITLPYQDIEHRDDQYTPMGLDQVQVHGLLQTHSLL